ncbi:uncharacterized protein LOC111288435 isoform X2 [Durio zibethinus]|uniref:Uncharacterized protein LOC111288435 isoform X2 n=1 Tax=Durio zibethinus TaxID=66656 RepID=A0A6P5Y3P8_DURZI|nr:uncharacterized protein LOC111288435 isoform X2 [Durio zibethinus]
MRSMVYSGDREMAMGPERSKPLHNFKLPCLKWGNQRYLRCMKLDDASAATDSSSSAVDHNHRLRPMFQRRRSPPSKFESLMASGMRRRESESSPSNNESNDYGRERRLRISKGEASEGIEAVREKIMNDLKTAADKIKDAIFRDEVSDDDEDEFEEPKQKVKEKQAIKEKERRELPAVEMEARPWNLRTRGATCKVPIDGEVTNNNYSSPMKNEVNKSSRVRDRGPPVASAATAENKRPRPKFSVPLLKKEIEEDFMVMSGHRPLRRPKKRARYIQKQLDSLFPGLWLTEVTVDSYKVPESVENGKR